MQESGVDVIKWLMSDDDYVKAVVPKSWHHGGARKQAPTSIAQEASSQSPRCVYEHTYAHPVVWRALIVRTCVSICTHARMHNTLGLSTHRAGVHIRTERAPYQSAADALSTHAIARSAHTHTESMASVDPITPSTVSVAATTTATASLSPTESNMGLPQPDPSPLSPTAQPTIMDTSTIPAEVSFPLPQQQPPPPSLTEVIIKPEAPALTTPPSTTPLKRPRHKPEERKELLEKAVRDVKEQKISMRKAASRYNIAKSSLCDYVRKNHIILPNNRCKPSATVAATTTASNNSGGGDYHHQHHHVRLDTPSVAVTGAPQTSVALQPPLSSAQAGSFSFSLDTTNLLRATHTATPPGGVGSGSVLSRLESPWNNVSGLPTQVPMQNWSSLAAQGKSMSSLSQASAASSPKQAEVGCVLLSSFPNFWVYSPNAVLRQSSGFN